MEHITNDLRLFVTGMDRSFTAKDLWGYLERFGSLVLIQEHKKVNYGSKGFIVTAGDRYTYSAILESNQLIFEGRALNCQPFFDSIHQLKRFNQDMNSRRVLLKRVPSNLSTAHVREVLEKRAGPIAKIYAYQSDLQAQQPHLGLKRRFQTFSVLFHNRDSAQQVILLEEIQLDAESEPAIVESFNFEKIKKKIHPQSQYTHIQKNLTKKVMIVDRSDTGFVTDREFNKPRSNLQPKYTSSPQGTGVEVLSDISKYNRIDINANVHSLKPTCTTYFNLNKKFKSQPESGLLLRLLIRRPQDRGHQS